jgi:predicted nuclease of predicted toxin-antitoxin system
MRVLLDESPPRRLKKQLLPHEVQTVSEAGWAGKKNGELLRLATEQHDVFVTADRSLPDQQNLRGITLSIVVLRARSNAIKDLLPLVPNLLRVLESIHPGEVVRLVG